MNRTARTALLAAITCATGVAFGQDADGDNINDADEQRWLNLHAPVLYTDQLTVPFQEGTGVPVDVAWLLRTSIFRVNGTEVARFMSLPQAIDLVRALGGAPNGALDPLWYLGDAPGDPRTWEMATQTGAGTFGRAWQPWPHTHPHLISLQYYLYTTWNETAFSGGDGNHEGDWTCIDLTVDTQANFDRPPIIHAIIHNHGRQLFSTPESLQFEDGRVVVFSERGAWEFWPNPGGRGKAGWPRRHGWATNADLDFACGQLPWYLSLLCTIGGVSESKVAREHSGAGHRLDWLAGDGQVDNVGDHGVSLCGPAGEFIQLFRGRWGNSTGGIFQEGTPPRAPVHNAKMRDRRYAESGPPVGPWGPELDPYEANLPAFTPYRVPGFDWYVPVLEPIRWVHGAAPDAGRGTPDRPFRDISLGIAMTIDGGEVRVAPGSFPGRFTISKPITITAPSGTVTLGN